MGEDDFKVSCQENQEDARNFQKQLLLGAGQWTPSGRHRDEWGDRTGRTDLVYPVEGHGVNPTQCILRPAMKREDTFELTGRWVLNLGEAQI